MSFFAHVFLVFAAWAVYAANQYVDSFRNNEVISGSSSNTPDNEQYSKSNNLRKEEVYANFNENADTKPCLRYTKTVLNTAVISIDVQNDFFPKTGSDSELQLGSLPVKDADEILPEINKLLDMSFGMKVLSLDSHANNHMSFASRWKKFPVFSVQNITLIVKSDTRSTMTVLQQLWPDHCIEGSYGAKIHSDVNIPTNARLVHKGRNMNIESYSIFGDAYDNKYENTGLHDVLQQNDIKEIVLTGLAQDYCVYFSAKDAVRLGYKVHLILSATRGVDQYTTDIAFDEMLKMGVVMHKDVTSFINSST
jgi:nicotinamidase/pyrazinamidase